MKLFHLLQTLSQQEWQDFSNHLPRHPLKQEQKNACQLFDYLITRRENLKTVLYDKELSVKVFNRKMAISTFGKVKSTLAKLLHNYFVHQKMQAAEYFRRFTEVQVLQERYAHSDTLFDRGVEKLRADWQEAKEADIWRLFWQMRLEHYVYYLSQTESRYAAQQLLDALDYLDKFSVGMKFRYATEFNSHKKNFKDVRVDIPLFKEIQQLSSKAGYDDQLIVRCYQLLYNMSVTDAPEDLNALLELYQFNSENLQSWDKVCINSSVNNFCARQIRRHHEEYYQQVFLLNKIALNENLFSIEDGINKNHYISIANTACSVGELDWANEFIESNRKLLPAPNADTAYRLAKTRYWFDSGNYLAADECLNQGIVNYEPIITQTFYALRLRIDYKIGETRSLIISNISRIRNNVKHHPTINRDITDAYVNFLDIFKLLLEGTDKAILLQKIADSELLILENWLLSEIDSIFDQTPKPPVAAGDFG